MESMWWHDMRLEMEQALNAYALRKFKSEMNGYEIILKPKGIDLNAPDIQDLLNQFRIQAIGIKDGRYNGLSFLYSPIRRLAITFQEEYIVKQLDKIWIEGDCGIPLNDLEQKLSRQIKRARLRSGKIITRSGMETSYKNIYQTLYDCFYHMVSHNNIPMEQASLGDMLAQGRNTQLNI